MWGCLFSGVYPDKSLPHLHTPRSLPSSDGAIVGDLYSRVFLTASSKSPHAIATFPPCRGIDAPRLQCGPFRSELPDVVRRAPTSTNVPVVESQFKTYILLGSWVCLDPHAIQSRRNSAHSVHLFYQISSLAPFVNSSGAATFQDMRQSR